MFYTFQGLIKSWEWVRCVGGARWVVVAHSLYAYPTQDDATCCNSWENAGYVIERAWGRLGPTVLA